MRARAIENLCYVMAAGQGGYHVNGRETYGHSMIVDPWGQVMNELANGSGLVCADIDLTGCVISAARFRLLNTAISSAGFSRRLIGCWLLLSAQSQSRI